MSDAETLPPVMTVLHDPNPSRRWSVTGVPVGAPGAVPLKVTGVDVDAAVTDVFRLTVRA